MSKNRRNFKIIPVKNSAQVTIQNANGNQQVYDASTEQAELEEKSFQDGYQQGFNDAQQQLQGELQNIHDNLNQFVSGLDSGLNEYFNSLEVQVREELCTLSLQIAEVILKQEINQKALIISAIKEVLSLDLRPKDIQLHLSPQDCTLLESMEEVHLPSSLQVVKDPKLNSGDAVLYSQQGLIDATIDGRLETLGDTLRRNLNLSNNNAL